MGEETSLTNHQRRAWKRVREHAVSHLPIVVPITLCSWYSRQRSYVIAGKYEPNNFTVEVSGYLKNTMKFKTSNLLLGWRATAGIECILGSAIYLKSTGMSLVRKWNLRVRWHSLLWFWEIRPVRVKWDRKKEKWRKKKIKRWIANCVFLVYCFRSNRNLECQRAKRKTLEERRE